MFSLKNAIYIRWRFLFFTIFLPALLSAKADLSMVNLHVKPDFKQKSIQVVCKQIWQTASDDSTINLLLYPQLAIDSLLLDGQRPKWVRNANHISILLDSRKAGQRHLRVVYHGKPLEAPNAPWDGGFVWAIDPDGKPWLTVACQDKGAALWWPAPEAYSDHPESAFVSCTYPANLFFKGNGQLVEDKKLKNKLRYTSWKSTYPINTYNLSLNIGDYGLIIDTLVRRNGTQLALAYYPLKRNIDAARRQFQQVKPMIDCYEQYFGPYPYERDGFSIVEVPYAGMEHQGAIAYGNGYKDGYLGADYSGIGLDFDFILIHESGHQWWGNAVTAAEQGDEWHQEAFCTYAEYTYVRCRYGAAKAVEYVNAKKRLVANEFPILSTDDSGIDMYSKGALMLYTLENLIGPGKWKDLLLELQENFRFKPLSTDELVRWMSVKTGRNLAGFFEQYLTRADIPVLEYKITQRSTANVPDVMHYRIANAVSGFQLPVSLVERGRPVGQIIATGFWQESPVSSFEVMPDENASYFSPVLLKN